MWLKLGSSEIINLDYISSIKKGSDFSIEISYHDFTNIKILPFKNEEERDRAFQAILQNLSKLNQIFE